ncbi:MAG TPA: hypothetical protein VKE69_13230 [Planctomycetota bacterium]|nr:hypothetical protein [Planctomycetota bacterium]
MARTLARVAILASAAIALLLVLELGGGSPALEDATASRPEPASSRARERGVAGIDDRRVAGTSETAPAPERRASGGVHVLRVRYVTDTGDPILGAMHTQGIDAEQLTSVRTIVTPNAPSELMPRLLWGGFTGLRVAREGHVEVDGEERLEIEADPPWHVSAVIGTAVLATAMVPPGAAEMTLAIPLRVVSRSSHVRVSVLDAAGGGAIEGAKVEVHSLSWAATSDTTDELGRIDIPELPGFAPIRVRAEARETRLVVATIPPGSDLELVVRLALVRPLHGTLVDARGAPAGAWVHVDSAADPLLPDSMSSVATEASSGEFLLDAAAGPLRVHATRDDAASLPVFLDDSRRTLGELPMLRGTPVDIAYRVAPDEVYLATLVDSEGRAMSTEIVRQDGRKPVVLAPGKYAVELRDYSGLRSRTPLVVGATALEVEVAP